MLDCARAEKKPLLLMFGANWCEWCRGLDQLLGDDKELAKLGDAVFLRLNVDIGQYDRNLDVAHSMGSKLRRHRHPDARGAPSGRFGASAQEFGGLRGGIALRQGAR